jgi:hypothetical protein
VLCVYVRVLCAVWCLCAVLCVCACVHVCLCAYSVYRTIREPIGVVAAVSAFNHPFNLIVHQAGTAIAAGCPVLVRRHLGSVLDVDSAIFYPIFSLPFVF